MKSDLIHTFPNFDGERSQILSAKSLSSIFHSLLHPWELGSLEEDTDRRGAYSCLPDPKELTKKIHGVLTNTGLSAVGNLLYLLDPPSLYSVSFLQSCATTHMFKCQGLGLKRPEIFVHV